MLILCCGPDTYRATQRAQELEAAFRSKHDPSGSSIDRLASGKRLVDDVIERSLAVSLFSPMRFIRADGLIEQCPKQKLSPLVHALGKDPERVIVVSIEQEPPVNTVRKSLSVIPKLIINDYPLLQGKAFSDWVFATGGMLGVTDNASMSVLAEACNGDSWLAANELVKLAAGGVSDVVQERETNLYELADAFLEDDASRYARLAGVASERVAYPLFQQALAALRVHDGETQGIPPFAVSKLKRADAVNAAKVTSTASLIMMASRTGLADAHELTTLL